MFEDFDEVYEEIDFFPKHKTRKVVLEITERKKYEPSFDFEEVFEEL